MSETNVTMKFYLRRIHLNNGGYESDGTYWGRGMPLYFYQCEADLAENTIEGYTRAYSREDAILQIRQKFSEALFFGQKRNQNMPPILSPSQCRALSFIQTNGGSIFLKFAQLHRITFATLNSLERLGKVTMELKDGDWKYSIKRGN